MLSFMKNIKTVIFDLDGTIWNWNELLPQVKYTIEKLRESGKEIYFMTNNTVLSREGLAAKLQKMGIRTSPERIITSGYSAAKYFRKNGVSAVYVIGEQGLLKELSLQGIKVDDDAKHVLISVDRNFNIWKLKRAFELVERGAKVYATGNYPYWQIGSNGTKIPAELPIIRALQAIVRVPVLNLGKPSEAMKDVVLKTVKSFPEDVVMVGDDIYTDVVLANRCGFRSVLVLTGVTSEEEARKAKGEYKPTEIIRRLDELVSVF